MGLSDVDCRVRDCGPYLEPSVVRILKIETAVTASNTVVEGQSDHGGLG